MRMKKSRMIYVGIGASAGGLEALRRLAASLPRSPRMTYIVAQHLTPQYRSMMVELVKRETALPVVEIQDGHKVLPGTIHIVPPNRNVVLRGDCLHLETPQRGVGPKPSIDRFFTSLAEEKERYSVGVILSGTGSDGAQGMNAIKAAGGQTFAQDHDSAKYDGMPSAAIGMGSVDHVLDPEGIARALGRLSSGAASLGVEPLALAPCKQLFALLKKRSGVDFSGYKSNTVRRRIQRRVVSTRCASMKEYCKYVAGHPEELDELLRDLLIRVTSFFRDKGAFKALNQELQKIISEKKPGEELRIWVAGCSTGEEAYSMAILVSEALRRDLGRLNIQIFATDVDEEAMSLARKGVYSAESLSSMPKPLLERYFKRNGKDFIVSKQLRELVVFAKQSFISDPPFLRLDLISCRNVLIYFGPEFQKRVFDIFGYALKPHGVLFLGKSESIPRLTDGFSVMDKRFKLFRRNGVKGQMPRHPISDPLPVSQGKSLSARNDGLPQDPHDEILRVALIGGFAPPSVLVDGNWTIVRTHGNVDRFLTFRQGKPSFALMDLVKAEIRADLLAMLHRCRKLGKRISADLAVRDGRKTVAIRAEVLKTSFPGGTAGSFYLVSFQDLQEALPSGKRGRKAGKTQGAADRLAALENELSKNRAHLQTVIEELETSNEELQSVNEELQAANEELQSSNEELETSNEELQSTNEELATVNEELNVKTSELSSALGILENIQNYIGYPLIVLDERLRVMRYNHQALLLVPDLIEGMGKPFQNLVLPRGLETLAVRLRAVFKSGQPVEDHIPVHDRDYLVKISAFRESTSENRGGVMTLIDQTERLRVQAALGESQRKLLAFFANTTAIVYMKNLQGQWMMVNRRFTALMGIDQSLPITGPFELMFPQPLPDRMRRDELEVIRTQRVITQEISIPTAQGDRVILGSVFPLLDDAGAVEGVGYIGTDISDRRLADKLIEQQRAQLFLSSKMSLLGQMAAGVAHELNTPLNVLTAEAEVLESLGTRGELTSERMLAAARRNHQVALRMSKIIRGLRAFARDGSHDPFEEVSLGGILDDILVFCNPRLQRNGVRLDTSSFDRSILIHCQRVQLSQVFLNLISNALDAVEGMETPWIRIASRDLGSRVEIHWIDSGPGVAPENRDRLMEPFFTTKPVGVGTGLGLSVSHGIVELHAGTLVYDEKSPETCFVVTLPKRQGE